MPIDISKQVSTALENIKKNPEQYFPTKSSVPLETLINDLKESNPKKYKEYLSTLTKSANKGNEKARELLGKIGEDAARERRGYEGLNAAMYIPAFIASASIATPALQTIGRGASWLYHQLPQWFKTSIDTGLTIDGIRNFASNNGVQKTIREAKTGNYGKAILSGVGDVLDVIGGLGLMKEGIRFINNRSRNIYTRLPQSQPLSNNTKNKVSLERRESWLDGIRNYARIKKDNTPSTFSKSHSITKKDQSKIKLPNEELEIIEDLPVPYQFIKYFENIPYQIAKRDGYNVDNIVMNSPRMGIYTSNKGTSNGIGWYFPKGSAPDGRDLTDYIFLNKEGFSRSTPTHELHHNFSDHNNILPKELTPEHRKAIEDAYPVISPKHPHSNDIVERRAVNEQLREEFVKEFVNNNGRLPQINKDKNELYDFLKGLPDEKFEEIIHRPHLHSAYLTDYFNGIKWYIDEDLRAQSFWSSYGISQKPSESWVSKMKYAIGNIPVLLGLGMYSNYNNKNNSNLDTNKFK